VQQSALQTPGGNAEGQPQKITFNAPSSVRAGAAKIMLAATADSKLPVYFSMRRPCRSGRRQVEINSAPPRAEFPVKVTVVAW
jgi:hypothetical protein